MLANEIMWQLMFQGVILPGWDANNPQLPHFHVTDYGREVLQAGRFAPHDPAGYLEELAAAAKSVVGQASRAYVEESLRCFNAGCHVASVLLLGVAAEAVLLELCTVARSVVSGAEQGKFDRLRGVKGRHRWIVSKYESLPRARRSGLSESLDLTLTSLYELIRRQRNELGHPQVVPPSMDREQAFIYFRLFPGFVRDVEGFAQDLQANGL